MRFTYDPAADALSIQLVPGAASTRTVKIAPDCNADLDARSRLVSIEILQASAYYPAADLERLAPTSDELTLLEAAAESELAVTTLRNQIRAGKLAAVKRGRDWCVPTSTCPPASADANGPFSRRNAPSRTEGRARPAAPASHSG